MSSEDRGVQVEARTLSGVHLGRTVTTPNRDRFTLAGVRHNEGSVTIWMSNGPQFHLAPTDLVTLTDGGAPS